MSTRVEDEAFKKSRCGIHEVGNKVFWCGPYADARVLDEFYDSFMAYKAWRVYLAERITTYKYTVDFTSFTASVDPQP